ncbi:MAG: RHS repeat protein, partial [Anaerolineales bacterium]|nr:RHS repeat protein [Anaerolineales bacterium]
MRNPSVADPCQEYTLSSNTALDLITRYTFDAAGNRLSVAGPDGQTRYSIYDGLGRLVSEQDALGHTTQYVYDAASNRVDMIDAEEVVTHYEYNALGKLAAVVENYLPGVLPDEQTNVRTGYGYSSLGERLAITDALTHTTSFDFDPLGRQVSESDPLGHTWQQGYDVIGSRVVMTDANGAATFFLYDGLGRLAQVDYPAPDADVSYAYNSLGWRTVMTDG